jgi:hypothetical protein
MEKTIWIMTCDSTSAIELCSTYIERFNENINEALDAKKNDLVGYFVDACQLLEGYRSDLKKGRMLDFNFRNSIRLTIKFAEKLALHELEA